MSSLLKNFVDADQWDAEDIAGRLGIVLHAAFIFAGFHPYGAQPPSGHLMKQSQSGNTGSSVCLYRLYTAPALARRKGADAAVLMLCVQGSDVALLMFLTTGREDAYLERLDLDTVRPLLSRELGRLEPWASKISRSLANGVCWGLLHELCRRSNVLPVPSSFDSLPDDGKAVILSKLTDGKDLARVQCVSSQLRHLVAERDHELWKPLYKALPARKRPRPGRCSCRTPPLLWFVLVPDNGESSDEETETETLGISSCWKAKYVEARRPRPPPTCSYCSRFFDSSSVLRRLQLILRKDLPSCLLDDWLFQDPPAGEEEMISTRVERRSGESHRWKLTRNDYSKNWHGSGAIHSPSSRYRWKHR